MLLKKGLWQFIKWVFPPSKQKRPWGFFSLVHQQIHYSHLSQSQVIPLATDISLTQQEPQEPWSLISLIVGQFGHCFLESKLSGNSMPAANSNLEGGAEGWETPTEHARLSHLATYFKQTHSTEQCWPAWSKFHDILLTIPNPWRAEEAMQLAKPISAPSCNRLPRRSPKVHY